MKTRWIMRQIETAESLDVVFPWERGARNKARRQVLRTQMRHAWGA